MKSNLLQTLRWSLIVFLSAVLLCLVYFGLSGVAHQLGQGGANVASIGGILITFLMMTFLAMFPAIMLYSLITKKLYGFASCVGSILTLMLFFGAMALPRKLGVMEMFARDSASPEPWAVFAGLAVAIGLLVLPFWLLSRMIRLTNEWIYPRLFKPLEDKI